MIFCHSYLFFSLKSRSICSFSVCETKRPLSICGNAPWSITLFSAYEPPSKIHGKISCVWDRGFVILAGRNSKIPWTPGQDASFSLKGDLRSATPGDNPMFWGMYEMSFGVRCCSAFAFLSAISELPDISTQIRQNYRKNVTRANSLAK